MFRFIDYL